MRFPDLLHTAFLNLWRRKLRAFLTVLGMVIGTSSIVVMVSLGVGIRQSMIESYASMGSLTNITVSNWRRTESTSGNVSYKEVKLDKKAVDNIRRIPGVVAAMPQITAWGMLMSGKYATDVSIMGIDMEQAALFGIEIAEGEFPSNKMAGGKVPMLMSASIYNNFYDPNANRWSPAIDKDGNPKVTSKSRLKLTFDYNQVYGNGMGNDPGYVQGKVYTVVPSGQMTESGNDFSWYCMVDIKVLEKLAKENPNYITLDKKNYSQVIVKCDEIDNVLEIKKKIEDMGFGASCIQEWLEQSEQQIKQTQYLLGAIGGVSLLVAAIGIMNTMMMSIYERTKEIGIIKVLGCRMSNIAALFLTEAAYIGFFGGALGLGLSYGLSVALNNFLVDSGFRSVIPAYLAVGALVFSVVVALISGLYPALRAMKLSPLAAIRNE